MRLFFSVFFETSHSRLFLSQINDPLNAVGNISVFAQPYVFLA